MKVLLVLIAFMAGLFCGLVEAPGFTTSNVAVERSVFGEQTVLDCPVLVEVVLVNREPTALHGLYYTEFLPRELVLETLSVTINGVPITSYVYESSGEGAVYPGLITHRWVLEIPPYFGEGNAVPAAGTLKIGYLVDSGTAGSFLFQHFSWVGYYVGGIGAAFGYSEELDEQALTYSVACRGDFNANGSVDLSDMIVISDEIGWTDCGQVLMCQGDLDSDGDVDGLDLASLVLANGNIDPSDLFAIANEIGRTNCGQVRMCHGDLDSDGDVDAADVANFALEYGKEDCPVCEGAL